MIPSRKIEDVFTAKRPEPTRRIESDMACMEEQKDDNFREKVLIYSKALQLSEIFCEF